MEHAETTVTYNRDEKVAPDDIPDEQLDALSKADVLALYRQARDDLQECISIRNKYLSVVVSLSKLALDFNDGTPETTGAFGVMAYVDNPEPSDDGTTGAWFRYARKRFEQSVQQPSNPATSNSPMQDLPDQESATDIHERTVLTEAREAAKRHFEKIGRSETFVLTDAYINNAYLNMSHRNRYVIYKNLARALHIFDTEWKTRVNYYYRNDSIPASVWAWWLLDKSSRVSARLDQNSVWVPMAISRETNTNAFVPAATENELEKYDIDGMPDESGWNISDNPK